MGKVIEFSKFKKSKTNIKAETKNETKPKSESKTTTNGGVLEGAKNSLFILIGPPCAGKSTYADNFVLNKPNVLVVSTDEIRKKLTGTYKVSIELNKKVFEIAKKIIHEALSEGRDVILDATNTNKTYRKSIINIAKRNNSKAVAVVFQTSLHVCLQRNSERSLERMVPEDVIIGMSKFTEVSKSEGFEEVVYIH